ncbi:hypothetical protein LTS10_002522 [Elasticomyces elasticus]|nr:hypothetical protein LTS10_002522 [Elasticomyces elasticus]
MRIDAHRKAFDPDEEHDAGLELLAYLCFDGDLSRADRIAVINGMKSLLERVQAITALVGSSKTLIKSKKAIAFLQVGELVLFASERNAVVDNNLKNYLKYWDPEKDPRPGRPSATQESLPINASKDNKAAPAPVTEGGPSAIAPPAPGATFADAEKAIVTSVES